MSSSSRQVEDVERVILHAKLNPSSLSPHSQVLVFGDSLLDASNVKFMEIDQFLADRLEAGESVMLRGNPDDSAVLCAGSKTYDVKEAETSNSLLVLRNLSLPDEAVQNTDTEERRLSERRVVASLHRYLELKECKPRLKRLRDLLFARRLSSKLELKHDEAPGITMADLLDTVQASEEDILTGLASLQACLVDGRWVLLDTDYQMKLVCDILRFAEENSWDLRSGQVDKEETADALAEFEHRDLVAQVFDQMFDENGVVKAASLSRFFGEYVLQTGALFDVTEFMTMWKSAVPEGIEPELSHLNGLAFVDRVKTPHTIKYFPEADLVENVQGRLRILFGVREKWTLEELEPYIEKLTTPKLNVNALVTKYARVSRENGVKYFSSKHGK